MTDRETAFFTREHGRKAMSRRAASSSGGNRVAARSSVLRSCLSARGAEGARTSRGPRGFTLFEILVVILLIGLLTALVAPAIRVVFEEDRSELETLIRGARDLAASRAETVYLWVAASGEWQVEGASEPGTPVAEGALEDAKWPAFTLIVSPLGTCALDVRSTAVAQQLPIEPLTCRPQLVAEEGGG